MQIFNDSIKELHKKAVDEAFSDRMMYYQPGEEISFKNKHLSGSFSCTIMQIFNDSIKELGTVEGMNSFKKNINNLFYSSICFYTKICEYFFRNSVPKLDELVSQMEF